MGLRDEQRELTRRTVLTAVLELLAENPADGLSVPAVADRSGVSLATIYRHFPTKDELIAAAAGEPARLAVAHASAVDPDADAYVAFVRTLWTELADNVSLVKLQLASPAGLKLRDARLSDSRLSVESYLETRGVDPASADGQQLVAMMLLISGSQSLVELHDRQQLDIERATDIAIWAIEALIDATRSQSEPINQGEN